ncbi:MAG: winged helix-turn-helix transcriptional regulator [Candidatus Dormibacteraeota bacterium]|nr:winged helix-turn-helix transcriptional regulator [Candidatus Dormibacteraeota bacterium]
MPSESSSSSRGGSKGDAPGRAQQATSKGVRGDRNLMQGEDPFTADPRDARTWISVYNQLIGFKHRLLKQVHDELERMPSHLRPVVREDLTIIQEQLDRYETRLEFWYARHVTLEGVMVDDETRVVTHRGATAKLTRREFQLFEAFLADPEHYVLPRQLVVRAWGDTALTDEELRTYIGSLRRKLAEIQLGRIINRRGRGYILLFGPQPNRP